MNPASHTGIPPRMKMMVLFIPKHLHGYFRGNLSVAACRNRPVLGPPWLAGSPYLVQFPGTGQSQREQGAFHAPASGSGYVGRLS